jgi:hypothetical protein
MIKFFIASVNKKKNKLVHLFKDKLIKSKINKNQIDKLYYNLGDIRWAKINLLSNFKLYNEHISKFGNLSVLIDKLRYVDINNHEDLLQAKILFQKK